MKKRVVLVAMSAWLLCGTTMAAQIPEELLDAFAQLNVRCTKKFPVLLEELADQQGLDILVLSRYTGQTMENALEKLRRNGNQAQLHLLEGGRL